MEHFRVNAGGAVYPGGAGWANAVGCANAAPRAARKKGLMDVMRLFLLLINAWRFRLWKCVLAATLCAAAAYGDTAVRVRQFETLPPGFGMHLLVWVGGTPTMVKVDMSAFQYDSVNNMLKFAPRITMPAEFRAQKLADGSWKVSGDCPDTIQVYRNGIAQTRLAAEGSKPDYVWNSATCTIQPTTDWPFDDSVTVLK